MSAEDRAMKAKRMKEKLKQKLPKRAFVDITFDREKIRKNINFFSYQEAARLKTPIYESLQDELYRAGCVLIPELIYCVSEKEKMLVETRVTRIRMTDERFRPMLYEIVQKLKNAELAVVQKKPNANRTFCVLFHEVIETLEPYKTEFGWVLLMAIEKLISLCHNIDGKEREAKEIVARIYYKYALHLENTGNMPDALMYLQKSLKLVKCRTWLADPKDKFGLSLHELVAHQLNHVMLDYAHQVLPSEPQKAIDLGRQAAIIILEIGREKNIDRYCKTFLARAYFLLENGEFYPAKKILDQIKTEIIQRNDHTFGEINIQYYLILARITEGLKGPSSASAILHAERALRLARIYEKRLFEADTLMLMGKIYVKETRSINLAKDCYFQARHIYVDTNNMAKLKQVTYLLAELKSREVMPIFMEMLTSSHHEYCALYNLRQWKNWCRPFWLPFDQNTTKKNYLYCLLDESEGDEVGFRAFQEK